MKRKFEISKETIIEAVHKNKCSNLDGLPVKEMNKETIIKHLEEVECPCLKKLKEETKPHSEK
jgi:hypothetical protein